MNDIFQPLTSNQTLPGLGRNYLWVPAIAIGNETLCGEFVKGKVFNTQKEALAVAKLHAQHLNDYLASNGLKL